MKCYCDTCEVKDCDLRDNVNFCEDCAEYRTCPLHDGVFGTCEAGYDIECNNGFELDEDCYPYPEYDEFREICYEDEEDEEE